MTDSLLHVFGVARVTLADDSGPIQLLQVDEGPAGADAPQRLVDKVKRVAEFGFASVPPLTSEVLLVRIGGHRSQTLVVGSNHQPSRLKNLQPGDSALYDERGAYLWLTSAGLVIDAAGLDITIRNYGTLTADGDLHVTGDVISRSAGTHVSLNALRDAYDAHKHTGVAAGSSSTGNTDHNV